MKRHEGQLDTTKLETKSMKKDQHFINRIESHNQSKHIEFYSLSIAVSLSPLSFTFTSFFHSHHFLSLSTRSQIFVRGFEEDEGIRVPF